MDIPLPPRPWYVKYRKYIIGGAVLAALMVYTMVLQLGPRTLKVTIGDEQMAVATEGEFLEYIDVNGVVSPATSMRVNAQEGGTVERICSRNGDVVRRGDTILVLSNPKVLEEIAAERQTTNCSRCSTASSSSRCSRRASPCAVRLCRPILN